MWLKYLDIFCRVFEKRSFSRAAEALYLTQPTVSSHIKALEGELKEVLFDRLGRDVMPTRAGELLYAYAQKIDRLHNEARQALGSFSGGLKGFLDIGGSTIPGEYLLPSIIGRFKASCPDVTVRLNVADSREISAMVLDGRVELGVVGANIEDSRIESREFVTDELVVIAAASYPIKSDVEGDLKGIPLVAREKGSGSWAALVKAMKMSGIEADKLNIVGEMGSTEAVKTAVKAGMGLSVVSSFAVEDELRSGSLKVVDLKGFPVSRKLYIITCKSRAKSPVCSRFLDSLEKNKETSSH